MTTLQRAALETNTRLEDLLDQLTLRHPVKVHDHDGHIRGWRTDRPLLEQLRRAKASATTYAADPGSSLRHTRTAINTEAIKLYDAIERRARSWAIRYGYDRPAGAWPLPEQVLRAWYALAKYDIDPNAYTGPLRAWVTQISNLLDPPHRFDIDKACPVCHAHILELDDPEGDEGGVKLVRALSGLERDPDIHQVTCRACHTQWDGIEAAEELADELAHAELLDRIAARWVRTLAAWERLTAEARA